MRDSPFKSEIKLQIGLDDQRVPEKLQWSSTDGPAGQGPEPKPCEAFMLSVWDSNVKESLRIDLWTKEMQRDEMDLFFFQTIVTMADTYARANGDQDVANMIRDFGFQFGEKTKLVMRKESQPAPGPGETSAEGILPNPPGGERPTTPDDMLPGQRPTTPDDFPTTPDTLG